MLITRQGSMPARWLHNLKLCRAPLGAPRLALSPHAASGQGQGKVIEKATWTCERRPRSGSHSAWVALGSPLPPPASRQPTFVSQVCFKQINPL